MGGKYTTFRVMASDLVRHVLSKNNKIYNESLSLNPLRQISIINDLHSITITKEMIEKIIKEEKVQTFNDLVHRRLSIPHENHINFESEKMKLIESYRDLKPIRHPHK